MSIIYKRLFSGIDESTTEHEKHIVITSTPEHGAKMKPECQNVDGGNCWFIMNYSFEGF